MSRLDPQVTGTILCDDADPTTIYIGRAAPGSATSSAVWRIQRITISGTLTAMQYANGNPEYSNVWDNRSSLTYVSY